MQHLYIHNIFLHQDHIAGLFFIIVAQLNLRWQSDFVIHFIFFSCKKISGFSSIVYFRNM